MITCRSDGRLFQMAGTESRNHACPNLVPVLGKIINVIRCVSRSQPVSVSRCIKYRQAVGQILWVYSECEWDAQVDRVCTKILCSASSWSIFSTLVSRMVTNRQIQDNVSYTAFTTRCSGWMVDYTEDEITVSCDNMKVGTSCWKWKGTMRKEWERGIG